MRLFWDSQHPRSPNVGIGCCRYPCLTNHHPPIPIMGNHVLFQRILLSLSRKKKISPNWFEWEMCCGYIGHRCRYVILNVIGSHRILCVCGCGCGYLYQQHDLTNALSFCVRFPPNTTRHGMVISNSQVKWDLPSLSSVKMMKDIGRSRQQQRTPMSLQTTTIIDRKNFGCGHKIGLRNTQQSMTGIVLH